MEFCGYDRDNVIKIVRQFHTILKKFQVRMKSLEGELPHLGYLEAAFHAKDTFVWCPKEPRCDMEPEKCFCGGGGEQKGRSSSPV